MKTINPAEFAYVQHKHAELQVVHVYPVCDPHETNGQPCWCEPEFEDVIGGTIVIHQKVVWQ